MNNELRSLLEEVKGSREVLKDILSQGDEYDPSLFEAFYDQYNTKGEQLMAKFDYTTDESNFPSKADKVLLETYRAEVAFFQEISVLTGSLNRGEIKTKDYVVQFRQKHSELEQALSQVTGGKQEAKPNASPPRRQNLNPIDEMDELGDLGLDPAAIEEQRKQMEMIERQRKQKEEEKKREKERKRKEKREKKEREKREKEALEKKEAERQKRSRESSPKKPNQSSPTRNRDSSRGRDRKKDDDGQRRRREEEEARKKREEEDKRRRREERKREREAIRDSAHIPARSRDTSKPSKRDRNKSSSKSRPKKRERPSPEMTKSRVIGGPPKSEVMSDYKALTNELNDLKNDATDELRNLQHYKDQEKNLRYDLDRLRRENKEKILRKKALELELDDCEKEEDLIDIELEELRRELELTEDELKIREEEFRNRKSYIDEETARYLEDIQDRENETRKYKIAYDELKTKWNEDLARPIVTIEPWQNEGYGSRPRAKIITQAVQSRPRVNYATRYLGGGPVVASSPVRRVSSPVRRVSAGKKVIKPFGSPKIVRTPVKASVVRTDEVTVPRIRADEYVGHRLVSEYKPGLLNTSHSSKQLNNYKPLNNNSNFLPTSYVNRGSYKQQPVPGTEGLKYASKYGTGQLSNQNQEPSNYSKTGGEKDLGRTFQPLDKNPLDTTYRSLKQRLSKSPKNDRNIAAGNSNLNTSYLSARLDAKNGINNSFANRYQNQSLMH